MDISNTLFQSLLTQQGYTNFLPIKLTGDKHEKLYGYFKEDHFFVCDETLNNIPINEINTNGDKTLLLINNKNHYAFKDQLTEVKDFPDPYPYHTNNWVIDADGTILMRNINHFTSLTPNIQIIGNHKKNSTLPIDSTYEFLNDNLNIPNDDSECGFTTTYIKGYDTNSGSAVIIDGKLTRECQYLFQAGELYLFDRGETLWIVNQSGKTIYLGSCKVIWNCSSNIKIISMNEDKNGKYDWIFHSIYRDKVYSNIIRNMPDAWSSMMFNAKCVGMSTSLLIYTTYCSSQYSDSITYIMSIDLEGNVIFYDSRSRSKLSRCANDLITIEDDEHSSIILDKKGMEIGEKSRSVSHNYIVFERETNGPARFNMTELIAKSKIEFDSRDKLYGVLNVKSGEVLIPCNFSHIDISQGKNGSILSIVSITNYHKGNRESYQGLYIDSKLLLPIWYDVIELIPYDINSNDSYHNIIRHKSDYLRFTKSGKEGLLYSDGSIIIEGCDEVNILNNGESRPNYAITSKNGKYALIHKDKAVSSHIFDKIESVYLKSYIYESEELAKVWKDGKCTIYQDGEPLIGFYSDIKPIINTLFHSADKSEQSDLLFIITSEDGKKGLVDINNEVVLPAIYNSLNVYNKLAYADDKYIDASGSILFDPESYERLTKVFTGLGSSICYANNEKIVFVETDTASIVEFDRHDDGKKYYYNGYEFNFSNKRFEDVEEKSHSYNYDDYDDYDYERETYYALGGSDYERWKNYGGTIDEMMDGLGL